MDLTILTKCVVIGFAVFITTASLIGVLNPGWLVRIVRRGWQSKLAMPLAVMARVFLGVALIYYASFTRFSTTFRLIGLLGLVAAAGLPMIGWQRIDNLMGWFQLRPTWLLRLWTLFGMFVGGFILYAAVQ